MNLRRTYIIFAILSVLLLAACGGNGNNENENKNESSNQQNENHAESHGDENNTSEAAKDYFEFGETFELIGYYSDEPMDVTVNDVKIDGLEDHQAYIEDVGYGTDDVSGIALIDMTVKNKGDSDIRYGDFIPKFTGMNSDIDITYPENDKFDEGDDPYDEVIEPGEEIHFIGSTILRDEKIEYESLLTFNGYDSSDGPFLYAVPQDERKTSIGEYGLEEEVFPVDFGDAGGVGLTFHEVHVEDVAEGMESEDEKGEKVDYVVIDATVENTTDETFKYDKFMPYVRTGEIENILTDRGYSTYTVDTADGERFNAYDLDIAPGEKAKVTLYGMIPEGEENELIISFFPYLDGNHENTTIDINPDK